MASIHEGFVQIHPELKLPLNNFINPNKNLHTDHHLQQWHISLSISFWQHGDTRTSWTTLTYFISSIGKRIFLFFSLNLISDERMNHFSPFYSRLSSVQTFHQLLDFWPFATRCWWVGICFVFVFFFSSSRRRSFCCCWKQLHFNTVSEKFVKYSWNFIYRFSQIVSFPLFHTVQQKGCWRCDVVLDVAFTLTLHFPSWIS